MNSVRALAIVLAASASAAANTLVDVSTHGTQTLNPGDALHFLISDLSLRTVDTLQFQFVTLAPQSAAEFQAELLSPDGSVSTLFPVVTVGGALMRSTNYSGAVTSISGTVALSGTVSKEVFQNTRATLVLHDLSGVVTLGLPGSTLKNDLFASVSSGGSAAGLVVNKVQYEDPPPAGVPEADSRFLVGGAGLLLCVFSRVLKRISDRRI